MRPADAVYIGFISGFMTAWKILPAVGKLLKSGFGVRPWTLVWCWLMKKAGKVGREAQKNAAITTTRSIAESPGFGRWVLVSMQAKKEDIEIEEACSVCGRRVYRYETQPKDNYCPQCGKMMFTE